MEIVAVLAVLLVVGLVLWAIFRSAKSDAPASIVIAPPPTLGDLGKQGGLPVEAPRSVSQLRREVKQAEAEVARLLVDGQFEEFIAELVADGWSYFHAHIAGVTFENDDGTSRQQLVRSLKPFDRLTLEFDEGNPHDRHATKVLTQAGEQVGWLSRDVARQVQRARETQWLAFVRHVGKKEGTRKWGATIVLFRLDEPETGDHATS